MNHIPEKDLEVDGMGPQVNLRRIKDDEKAPSCLVM